MAYDTVSSRLGGNGSAEECHTAGPPLFPAHARETTARGTLPPCLPRHSLGDDGSYVEGMAP